VGVELGLGVGVSVGAFLANALPEKAKIKTTKTNSIVFILLSPLWNGVGDQQPWLLLAISGVVPKGDKS
jgi:hypothetical protein